MIKRAVLAVIYGFLGTLVSGVLVLGPLAFVIEARAAGARLALVAQAQAELVDLIEDGVILDHAFPDRGDIPASQRREPMRQAVCEDRAVGLVALEAAILAGQDPGADPAAAAPALGAGADEQTSPGPVRAHAALCLTQDGRARRLFVVGLSWDEAAPIRAALRGLHPLRDVPGLGWIAPRRMGVVVYQKIWP